jgi:hypothetical protein
MINPFIYAAAFAANEVLHLDFEGANGSTTITDSLGRHSPIAFGSAAISTAWASSGTSSLSLPSGANYVQVRATVSTDFIHAGDFSYKCVIKVNSLASILLVFFNTNSVNGGTNGTTMMFNMTVTPTSGLLKVTAGPVFLTGTAVVAGTPQTVELRRVGSTVSLIQDGVTTATASNSSSWGSGYLGIGGNSATVHFNGYIDQFVVTKN